MLRQGACDLRTVRRDTKQVRHLAALAHEGIEGGTNLLCRAIGLEWFVNVQFIGPYLLEINPRISTIVYQDDLNLPYLAVKHAVGELTQAELAAYGGKVRSTRRALRYYDQVEWDDDQ